MPEMYCAVCAEKVSYDGRGSWVDSTDGDGCEGSAVHRPIQDATFYVYSNEWQTVWDENPRFYVCRNGEMRIHARTNVENEYQVIRYSDDLERVGVTTEAELLELENRGEDYFIWDDNPWFEVCSRNDEDADFCQIMDSLDDAVAYAVSLWEKHGESGSVWE